MTGHVTSWHYNILISVFLWQAPSIINTSNLWFADRFLFPEFEFTTQKLSMYPPVLMEFLCCPRNRLRNMKHLVPYYSYIWRDFWQCRGRRWSWWWRWYFYLFLWVFGQIWTGLWPGCLRPLIWSVVLGGFHWYWLVTSLCTISH